MTQGNLRRAALAVLLLTLVTGECSQSDKWREGAWRRRAWAAPAPSPVPCWPARGLIWLGTMCTCLYIGGGPQGRGAYSTSVHCPGFAQ